MCYFRFPVAHLKACGGLCGKLSATGLGRPTDCGWSHVLRMKKNCYFCRVMDQQHQSYYFSKRSLCWDEQNRLMGVADKQYLSLYQYDADGERTYKLTGELTSQNVSGTWNSRYQLYNATLYASPYLVVTPQGYTKHYYAESERIASKLGNGGLQELDHPVVAEHLVGDKFVANTEHAQNVVDKCLHAEDARPSAPLSYL